MKYRFFVEIAGTRLQVHPLEIAKLKKVTAKERDQIFYRTKLNGQVVLQKDAGYQALLALEQSADRCTEVKFVIERDCSGFWEEDWRGYFSLNDVSWNLSKCTASFTPQPDDRYRAVLENYGKAHNILSGTTPVTTVARLDLQGDFEFLLLNADAQPDTDSDTWAEFILLNYFVDGTLFEAGQRYFRKIWYRLVRHANLDSNGIAPELGNGWQNVGTDGTRAKYAKRPDLYAFKPYDWDSKGNFTRYPELMQIPCNQPIPAGHIDVTAQLTGDDVANGCIDLPGKLSEQGNRYMKIAWAFGTFPFTRNRTFTDVLSHLITQTAGESLLANGAIQSDFFSSPVNYVTERPNSLTGLQIATASDVVGYNSSEAATKAEYSLKKILDNLRNMFRVFWDITDEGVFRLEHESFYQLQGVHDLTVYERELRATEAYTYEKEEMPRFQRLVFQSANNDDFVSGEIEYGGVCVVREEGKDTQESSITDVITDLEYLVVSGGTTAQQGLVFMLSDGGQVMRERGDITGQEHPNAGLSAANLVADYYTHNRVLENGSVNKKMRIFRSVNKTKKQMTLKVPGCCELLNPYARFVSTLGGNAMLAEVQQSVLTGTREITLLHDTFGTGNVSYGRQFDDSFDNSFR